MQIVIVCPALADANNGNWRTARRWSRMLAPQHTARIVRDWPDAHAEQDEVMLALHARRSAASVAAWARQRGSLGLGVVLTGTDLYRDIATDATARRSLKLAQALVVLQELGPGALPEAVRAKACVIFQSTSSRATLAKTSRCLRAVMVGHLRDEKDPLTLMAAAGLLEDHSDIRIDHIGAPLDAALGRSARHTMASCTGYRWLGGLSHPRTRSHIQRAHVLVHASRMEGGAHVVLEAVRSGTPVIASRIDGNVGMLGAGYAGYFPPGDAAALANLLLEARRTQDSARGLLARLGRQCAKRSHLFDPLAEQRALRRLVARLAQPQ